MATVRETIDIQIREDGSRVVKRNIDEIGKSAEKSSEGVDLLKRALGAMATYLAVDKLRQFADGWASATGKIRVATRSLQEAAAVTQGLFEVAQRTRQGFGDISDLYSRTARAGKELQASQAQLIQFTENVGKTLAFSGTTAEQARGALLQLGQALGGGVVRAEEFNSVLEGAPAILQVVANQIEGAGGSIGQLRRMMLDGQLTSKVFFDAMLAGSEEVDEKFNKAAKTISQSITIMSNAFMRWVGQTDQQLGVSQKFGVAAQFIAANMNEIANAALAAGAAIAVAFAPAAIVKFTAAVRALWVVLLANPLLAVAAAITAAVTYLAIFEDQLDAGIDKTTTMGDVFDALWADFKAGASEAGAVLTSVFNGATATVTNALRLVDIQFADSAEGWGRDIASFYDEVEGTGFAQIVRSIAKTMDAIEGFAKGLYEFLNEWFSLLERKLINNVKSLNNKLVDALPNVSRALGLETQEIDTSAAEGWGVSLDDAMFRGFSAHGDRYQKWVEDIFGNATKNAQERLAQGAQTADLTQPMGAGGPAGTGLGEKELRKLEKELRSIVSTVASAEGAWLELARAEEVLDKAVQQGLITRQQQATYLELVEQHYLDIADPLGAMLSDMQEETELLGMNALQRERYAEYLSREQELRRAGVVITQETTDLLMKEIEALQQRNLAVQAQDSLLANSVDRRREYMEQIRAINELLKSDSGFTMGDAAVATNDILQNMGINTDNLQVGMDARVEMYRQMNEQITQLERARLIDEQTASAARLQIWQQEQEIKLAGATTFFGALASLSSSSNSKVAAIGKAAAISQAIINTYLGATKALAEGGPYLGPALAAAMVAQGMAQVSQIQSQNVTGFKEGGYTGSMGINQVAGVVHGREYVMTADTVSRVGVDRLNAIQSGADVGGGTAVVVKPTVYNNAAGTVSATVNTNENEDGELEIEVIIDQVEQGLARRVNSGDSPLLSSMSRKLGTGIKPGGY